MGFNNNSVVDLACMRSLGLHVRIKPSVATISVRWLPPPMDFIKINTDGSEIKGVLQGGAVYRDSMGFIFAAFMRKMGKGQAFEAEILAA